MRTYVTRQRLRLQLVRPHKSLQAEPECEEGRASQSSVEWLLANLPVRYRRALELRYLESVPAKDAASQLKCSVDAYRKLLERARRQVRSNTAKFVS